MVRTFLRDAALPCTWLLLHTSVTANQVTFVAMILGLLGCFFVALPGAQSLLIGSLLLQTWYYLDHVDGQIARYRKQATLTGRFFDFFMHHVIHTILFLSFAIYLAYQAQSLALLVMGSLAAFSLCGFNLIHDIEAKTFLERIDTLGGVRTQSYRETPDFEEGTTTRSLSSSMRKAYSIAHKSCEIHVVMNVLSLFSFVHVFFPNFNFLRLVFFMYYLLLPLPLLILKAAYWIRSQKIDSAFNQRFHHVAGHS